MKRKTASIIGALILSVAMVGTAWAAETREEKNINKEAAGINTAAGTAQGEKVVRARLEKEFNVTDAQIQGLRDQKLGYGEMAIALSLAQKMPGGATDANINQVMTLRQGPPVTGWGAIAKKLGTKLGPAVSQVRTMNRETSREMKSLRNERGMSGTEGERGGPGREGMGHEGGPGMSHGKGR